MEISVSFLKGLDDMETRAKRVNESSADYIHVDQMDGVFVANTTILPRDIKAWVGKNSKPLEVHLMTEEPQTYFKEYQELNTKLIYVHYEIKADINEVLKELDNLKIKKGIAINPPTPVSAIKPLLSKVDSVLVMSVTPGEGGQKFMPSALTKIQELTKLRSYLNLNYDINVDGGVNNETARLCFDAGVDRVVSGAYICENENINEYIDKIKNQ
ncbi:MAG: ribulose-phosphate 3-epimerase [Bacilli bacterium]|nr:ribulose-phosphate 3-epimerase [Bacilli bacterium]